MYGDVTGSSKAVPAPLASSEGYDYIDNTVERDVGYDVVENETAVDKVAYSMACPHSPHLTFPRPYSHTPLHMMHTRRRISLSPQRYRNYNY